MRTDPKPYIILVEDEAHLARLVATHLENAGMEVQAYDQAAPALRFLKRNFANLLLLDVNLPDMTGFELLTELHRCDIRVPTIFLTGNTLETDKLQGLGLGDDYITKPFNYAELVARIHAVLRRAGRRADLNVTENVAVADAPFEFCGAHIVPARLEVTFPDAPPEKLGRKELGIIAHLHANRSQVLTREALIHAVWGEHANVTSRSLDQYVARIRLMFRHHGLSLDCFRTVHGIGYIFDPEGTADKGK